ncbi:prominin-2 [Dipodomys spectabilis]|uniref:prominin-2 n=1 Tax=Dipodomys spectabilis TaxID=105255 RepID=UPI001C543EFB|nr:prominin-2 [Dipodomys spectabilis]XP_042551483.1 prominin-2 [Dipodomys spectabilis]XP_042551484.1 prominin-2 [Dipodomys spectabilis]
MRVPGLMVSLLSLELGLALSPPHATASDCGYLGPAERLTFTPAARTRWLAPLVRAPGPLDPLYGTVRRFLSVVQLNPFPTELVKALLNEPSSVKVDEVVRYEAGYVVCAVIAGLFLLAVPITGLCFCCCRCHRRCGGRVKTEHKAMACERGTLMAFLLLTTFVLLVGMVCAFVTNQRTHEQTGPSVQAVPETLLSLQSLVSDIPEELQTVADQFSLPQNQVLEDLDGVGERLGNLIHSQLKSKVYLLLASVHSLGQALQVSMDHLRALNATTKELQEGQQHLEPAVRDHRERLLALLQDPQCQGNCTGTLSQVHALELGADFSQVPHLDDALYRLKDVPETNFSSMVQEENSTFNNLPLLIGLQTANAVKDLKKAVSGQPEGVRMLATGFPDLKATSRWSQTLGELEECSRPYLKDVQRYETYRWIVGCVLCSMVLLVVVCNLLGLSLGTWGLSAREDPSHSEAKGEAGARFLMLSVSFSFLFAGPLILLVFATFLVGGNVQTLVCQSWERGELYEFVDTPGNLPPSMNLSRLLGLKKNISVLLAYQQCREGAALWKVLQLNDSYDLEKHLDISQYATKMQQELKGFNVEIKDLDLLSPEARQDLEALQSSGIEKISYHDFFVQIQKPVVKTDMQQLSQDLERLVQAQGNSMLGQQLQEAAQGLRNLYHEKVVPQQNLIAKLNLNARALESAAPNLQLETTALLGNITVLRGELPVFINHIMENASRCFMTRELGYFSQYVAWVREEVTQRIATCQPFSGALDNGRVILCDMMADPWNAFWFCLGWCTFFLIPSIIFAVKTSKYFRPIRKRLSSTSSEETQLFHIPRVTSLKL